MAPKGSKRWRLRYRDRGLANMISEVIPKRVFEWRGSSAAEASGFLAPGVAPRAHRRIAHRNARWKAPEAVKKAHSKASIRKSGRVVFNIKAIV